RPQAEARASTRRGGPNLDFDPGHRASSAAMTIRHTGLLAAVAVAGTLAIAWPATFTAFPPYDDEGYVLAVLIPFVRGRALYDEVYTQHGPFPFVVASGLLRI